MKQMKENKQNRIYTILIKSSYKNSLIFLYNNNSLLIKQWSIRSKNYLKTERKKNTKYNLSKMVLEIKNFLIINKIKYLKLIFIGRGLNKNFFLDFLLENSGTCFFILTIKDKTPVPFNGCRRSKKKR